MLLRLCSLPGGELQVNQNHSIYQSESGFCKLRETFDHEVIITNTNSLREKSINETSQQETEWVI